MPFLVGLLLVLLALIVAFWIIGHLVGLVIALIIAGLIGLLAERIVPGRTPYGLLGAVVAGLLGVWVGAVLLGHLGPALFGIALLPATVGAIIVVAAAKLVFRVAGPDARRIGGPMPRGRLR